MSFGSIPVCAKLRKNLVGMRCHSEYLNCPMAGSSSHRTGKYVHRQRKVRLHIFAKNANSYSTVHLNSLFLRGPVHNALIDPKLPQKYASRRLSKRPLCSLRNGKRVSWLLHDSLLNLSTDKVSLGDSFWAPVTCHELIMTCGLKKKWRQIRILNDQIIKLVEIGQLPPHPMAKTGILTLLKKVWGSSGNLEVSLENSKDYLRNVLEFVGTSDACLK